MTARRQGKIDCARCGREIQETERFQYLGQTLCEDCYIDMRNPPKACDPWAVYSATRLRQSKGITGSQGLTEMQKAIFDFIREKGKVSRQELIQGFQMREIELQTQLAVLRHCELVKGHKEGNRVLLVPFDENPE